MVRMKTDTQRGGHRRCAALSRNVPWTAVLSIVCHLGDSKFRGIPIALNGVSARFTGIQKVNRLTDRYFPREFCLTMRTFFSHGQFHSFMINGYFPFGLSVNGKHCATAIAFWPASGTWV